jgi:hypothetical protein
MEISAEQFNAIMQELRALKTDGMTPEKRRAPRLKQDATVVITLRPQSRTVHASAVRPQSTTVTIRNISSRGVAILFHQPMTRGEQFLIAFSSPANPQVTFLCTIAHCRKLTQHQYVIGSEFTCIIGNEPEPTVAEDDQAIRCVQAAILD